jgi:hypothetical protein
MSSIEVKIQLLDIGLTLPAEIPVDMKVSQIIDEVSGHLSLPSQKAQLTDGRNYELFSLSLGTALHGGTTLADAKIPSADTLILSAKEIPGGGIEKPRGRINLGGSIGLPLDDLKNIEVHHLLRNEPALILTLHSYRATLKQLDDSRQEFKVAEE